MSLWHMIIVNYICSYNITLCSGENVVSNIYHSIKACVGLGRCNWYMSAPCHDQYRTQSRTYALSFVAQKSIISICNCRDITIRVVVSGNWGSCPNISSTKCSLSKRRTIISCDIQYRNGTINNHRKQQNIATNDSIFNGGLVIDKRKVGKSFVIPINTVNLKYSTYIMIMRDWTTVNVRYQSGLYVSSSIISISGRFPVSIVMSWPPAELSLRILSYILTVLLYVIYMINIMFQSGPYFTQPRLCSWMVQLPGWWTVAALAAHQQNPFRYLGTYILVHIMSTLASYQFWSQISNTQLVHIIMFPIVSSLISSSVIGHITVNVQTNNRWPVN
jgi:hypothetical protein